MTTVRAPFHEALAAALRWHYEDGLYVALTLGYSLTSIAPDYRYTRAELDCIDLRLAPVLDWWKLHDKNYLGFNGKAVRQTLRLWETPVLWLPDVDHVRHRILVPHRLQPEDAFVYLDTQICTIEVLPDGTELVTTTKEIHRVFSRAALEDAIPGWEDRLLCASALHMTDEEAARHALFPGASTIPPSTLPTDLDP